MIKKLTTIGNSLGLIIERPILELLRIDRETPLEVRTDGEALVIRPVRADETRGPRVAAVADKLMARHDETLHKLAE